MRSLVITIRVENAREEPLAVKSSLELDCEKYGDVVSVDVKEGPGPEQLRIGLPGDRKRTGG